MEPRNYQAGAAASPPSAPGSPSNGYPSNGNPSTGKPATLPGEFWFYKVGEEIRNAIVGAGLTPTDSALNQLALAIPILGTGNTGYMLVKDTKASGTDGGSSVAGNQTRTLNTVEANTIIGASLSLNQITLPAGTYRIHAETQAFRSNQAQAFLYNITDVAEQARGMSVNGNGSANTDPVSTPLTISTRFTITGAKVFELRMYISDAYASFGCGTSVGQGTETYSVVEIIKES